MSSGTPKRFRVRIKRTAPQVQLPASKRDWSRPQYHSPEPRLEKEPQVIAEGCRYLYEEEALAIQRSFRSQLEASQIAAELKLERLLAAQKRFYRHHLRDYRSRLSAEKLKRASLQGGLTLAKRRISKMEASEPFSKATILTVADHISSGLSFRGACRLAHLSIPIAEKALAAHRAGKAVGRQKEFAEAVEEAVGKNEALWVDAIRDAVGDKVVNLEAGQTLRRGDAKVAMTMLSKQHLETYGDKLALTATRAPDEDLDLSRLSDEELALLQAAEALRERLQRGAAPVAALVAENGASGLQGAPEAALEAELVGETDGDGDGEI